MTLKTQLNKDDILLPLNGEYNPEAFKKLTKIIHKIAFNKIQTNPTLTVDDLSQEAWARVLEVIKLKAKEGVEVPLSYLVITAKNAILANCYIENKNSKYIDNNRTMVMNSDFDGLDDSKVWMNNQVQYELSKHLKDEIDSSILKLGLEEILENLEDSKVKSLILIRYVKECGGTSVKIVAMYEQFRNTLNDECRQLLDNMNKFTNNTAFKILGMRATDNSSTIIRKEMKSILSKLM